MLDSEEPCSWPIWKPPGKRGDGPERVGVGPTARQRCGEPVGLPAVGGSTIRHPSPCPGPGPEIPAAELLPQRPQRASPYLSVSKADLAALMSTADSLGSPLRRATVVFEVRWGGVRAHVRTSSGATAVQIVHSSWRGSRRIEHLGSAHTQPEVEALKAAAAQRLAEGQAELDPGMSAAAAAASGGALEIVSSRKWGICGTPCRGPSTCSDSTEPPRAMRCSGGGCWRGSSSRPASRTACEEAGARPRLTRP